MNPKQYEWLALERGNELRRDAAGHGVLTAAGWPTAERRRLVVAADVRKALVRVARALRAGRLLWED